MSELGAEFREARLSGGISQRVLGRSVEMSATKISRIEAGKLTTLSLWDASRIAAVLGLELHVRAYPAGPPLRDAAHSRRLSRLLSHVRQPLLYRSEVPLPQRADQPRELRAWDAVVIGSGCRTAIELEMRLRDAQAVERRISAKRRDDPVDGLVLAVADTRTNRAVLTEHGELFRNMPRLRTGRVLALLDRGQHPPSGLILL